LTEPSPDAERSYGCTFGCGNPYDFVMIDVRSGTTEFLCLPDFIRMASDLVAVVTDPSNPDFIKASTYAMATGEAPAPGPGGRGRGKNAPATNIDPDLFGKFDTVITVDELPPEFR
jgi:hypothetical protein